MRQNLINELLNSRIFPVVEFSVIFLLIIITYWGMHSGKSKRIKTPIKFTLSMFLGSFAYMAAKVILITIFGVVATPDTAYAF